jgi:hypothetical protein
MVFARPGESGHRIWHLVRNLPDETEDQDQNDTLFP